MTTATATQPSQRLGAVFQPFQGGKWYYQVALILFFITIFLNWRTGAASALRYLLVLFFFSFLVFDARATIATFARSFWLLPIQLMTLLSIFWSPLPGEALRTSILFIMSTMVIIIMASQYTPRQIARCLMFVSMIAAIYSFLHFMPLFVGGPYGSKNSLASHMLVGFILCLTFALDPQEHPILRASTIPFIGLIAYIIVGAQSTTALLLMMGSAAIVIFGRIIFVDLQRIQNVKTLIFVLGIIAFLGITYAALAILDQALLDRFLGFFGKDSTLTGRTALWSAAQEQIRQTPVLGVGMEGFWFYDSGAAQTLNEYDAKPFGTKLTFHNSYFEVAVHLGYVGLFLYIISLVWVVWQVVYQIFTKPDMIVVLYAVVMIIALITTMTESVLWGPFSGLTTLFFVGGAAYAGRNRRQLLGYLVAKPAEPAASGAGARA